MKRLFIVASLMLAGCISGNSPAATEYNSALNAFGQADTCDGPELDRLRTAYDDLFNYTKRQNSRRRLEAAADALVREGDFLSSLRCFAEARESYNEVLVRFTGTAYAAYRERAIVGITEVRASGR